MTRFQSEGHKTEVMDPSDVSKRSPIDESHEPNHEVESSPNERHIPEGIDEDEVVEGVIERMENDPQAARRIGQLVHQAEFFHGPIPPPAVLKEYAEIDPSLPDRILKMAELEQQTKADISRSKAEFNHKALQAESGRISSGQRYGTIIALAAFASATICAIVGATSAAIVIGGATVVSLVGAFVVGRLPELREGGLTTETKKPPSMEASTKPLDGSERGE